MQRVFNVFVRFHQLRPKDAIILFDEADAHLHPDLERRYLDALRAIGRGNQLWLTTHSPEMMIAAGSESLYTVLKEPPADGGGQFVRVTQNEQLHTVLSEVMGSRGIVSFNQRVVFIEGEDASADRMIYEAAYPPGLYNVSFVPAGNSATARKTAERVNELLSTSIGFQQYYSIVDGDIDRSEPDPTGGARLFKLPVYHVENLLLNSGEIFEATQALLGPQCPYETPTDAENALRRCILSDRHVKPFTKALLDARLAAIAKVAYDDVYKRQTNVSSELTLPTFTDMESEARATLQVALSDGTWTAKCKGRDVLKAYCHEVGLAYEHLRNLLISRISTPPKALADIMGSILGSN